MQIEKIINYTAIDFLKDKEFLKWQLFSNEEDNLFWANVIEEYPALNHMIEEAVALYKNNVRFNDYSMSRREVTESLTSLHRLINEKRKRNVRRIILGASAVVAGIAVFIVVLPFIFNKDNNVQDITTFAQTLHDDNNLYSSDTKLILSECNTVILDNTESIIEYEADAIKADDNLILKEESSTYNQLITPFGKRSTITFSDGTKAWVNAGSKLVYPAEFSKDKREVYIDGEMYVEVTEDKKRPFVVKTKRMNINVLGTNFNVSAYESDKAKSVVLLSGSVQITSNTHDKKIVLTPNQMYSNVEDVIIVENVDADSYVLWTQGLYKFESEKLSVIVTRLARYYGKNIGCEPTIEDLKCSGKLDLKDDLNKLLNELSRALSIEYRQNANGDFILNDKFKLNNAYE